jgi:hypothetical protein
VLFDLGARITARWSRGNYKLWSLSSRSRFVDVFADGSYDPGSLSRAANDPLPFAVAGRLVVARNTVRGARSKQGSPTRLASARCR